MKETRLGIVLMLTASFCFTVQNLAVKLAASQLNVWQVGAGRFVVGLTSMLLIWRMAKLDLWGRRRRALVFRGLVGTTAFLCQVAAVQMLPISMAMVLFFMFPIFAALVSIRLNHEPISPAGWLLIGGAFAGLVIIIHPDKSLSGLGLGHLMAIIGAFGAGMATSMIRYLRRDNNVVTLYFYFCLIGALVTAVPLSTAPGGPLPGGTIGWVGVTVSSFLALGGQMAMNHGFKYIAAGAGGVIMMSQVVLAGLIGVLYLDEPLTWQLVVGATLILGCGLALSRLQSRGAAKPAAETSEGRG